MDDSNISSRIKTLREHYQMDLREFAQKCGVSHSLIHLYETGKRKKVNITTIYKIIEVFHTTKEWLTEGKGEMLPQGLNHKLNADNETNKFWQDEVYIQQESKIQMLEKEVNRLWNLVDKLTKQV